MKAERPPMGWNSWNTFAGNISDGLIRETADAMIETGLHGAGYEYVIIDDCWSKKERGADGRIQADPEKFPDGMKAVGDYIHGKGLKFGMYSCGGTMTCACYPGSYGHEFIDAETFASFGADYLKYDYCYHPQSVPGPITYRRMATALANCGRDIFFAACSWGSEKSEQWMAESGAHSFRSTGDIQDNWKSASGIAQRQHNREITRYGRPGCWNDMDMLIVGMHGKGHVGLGGCTAEEYKTHFSVWCMYSSPLIIGCDIRNMDEETRGILMNRDLIAIDQDPEGRPPVVFADPAGIQCTAVYLKMLSDGSWAVCFTNYSDAPVNLSLVFWDAGFPCNTGYGLKFRDLWAQEDAGVYRDTFCCTNVAPHASHIYRATVVKL